jgi:hypothetical protein
MTTPRTKLIISALALMAFALSTPALIASVIDGTGTPAAGTGTDGDYYIRKDTGQIYKKTSSAWSVIANVRSAKGDKGDRGETGLRGMAGPTGAPGPNMRTVADATARAALVPRFVPELIVQLDNSTLWRATGTSAGSWAQVATPGATGPTGPTGLTGPTGPTGLPGAVGPAGPVGTISITSIDTNGTANQSVTIPSTIGAIVYVRNDDTGTTTEVTGDSGKLDANIPNNSQAFFIKVDANTWRQLNAGPL